MAGQAQGAGFRQFSNPPTVVGAASCAVAPFNSRCVLTGRIVEQIPGYRDLYLFKDDSGEIAVLIRPHVFGDFIVDPRLEVYMTGRKNPRFPNVADINYLGIIGPARE